ncbi:ABC transporter permease subunit [Nocardia tengchongensis]
MLRNIAICSSFHISQRSPLGYTRGERRSTVVLREVLPNALLPVLTVSGINFGTLPGGLVIVESVFAWPGLTRLPGRYRGRRAGAEGRCRGAGNDEEVAAGSGL